METLAKIVGFIALIVGTVIYSAYSWGYVCFKFWGWFITPVFQNLPTIGFNQAVGIMFFIGLFRSSSSKSKDDDENKYTNMITALAMPWITFLIASFFS